MQGCGADAELQLQQLELQLYEIYNSLKHLKRSQQELETALGESPEDEDYRQALEENQRVIVKKEKKAASVKEQVNSLRRLLRIPPTTLAEEVPGAPGSEGGHQPKSDSQTKVIRPPAQEQAQGIDTADGGMYL